jgi:anti-anti-sigma regulatory factor/DNA-directed RNA polymerase subunit RPC12/RpoP
MSNKLAINIKESSESEIVEFYGPIDEDATFDEVSRTSHRNIIFDFDKVTLINSCGIREWVKFIEGLSDEKTFSYVNCRQIIIEQINMVKGFIREGSRVDNFYAPYYCESCDKEFKIHLKYSQVENLKAPSVKCPECNDSDLEFDAIEAQYFQFIK